LSLNIRPGQKRIQQILDFIEEHPDQPGIIYCMSRKSTEELAEKLRGKGIKAQCYHAGLPDQIRSETQDDFVADRTQVICATVAFGMGIDKSNVRWVMHYNLPKNVESYYQEIGRAGRDGLPSDTLLFYSYADVSILKELLTKNESEQQELKLAKLDRMYQYATAPICRRRTLLSYFGEELKENCGNCDVCQNPPEFFDGTVIAQKALSAIARLKENVGMNMLINVLRGSGQRAIFERGYDQIKTYGAGRDIGYLDWQRYLEQLLNLGLIEIAHERYHNLQLTPLSKAVLFDGEKVELVRPEVVKKRTEAEKKAAKTERRSIKSELFEALRQLRTKLARQRGVPPYIIFSDATLEDMAQKKPLTDAAMEEVSGVGARKLHLYGEAFMEVIREFVKVKVAEGVNVPGGTLIHTLELFKAGKSVAEIAEERGLVETTIYTHLAKLYEQGKLVDIEQFISQEEMNTIVPVLSEFDDLSILKPIHERLDGAVSYIKIRFAIAHFQKTKQTDSSNV
ncbi:MAG: RecQ family ATP-dependent DNA helicase, partial [Phaeodactylibacter sp.]|nr:RecQ family ATP-dependent DNA helicase [Phaeodactylibacter sp.]